SFALVDLNYMEKSPPPVFDIKKLEPLSSQFKLSYNTVLNLAQTLTDAQIATYFQQSFASFVDNETFSSVRAELADVETKLNSLKQHVCTDFNSYRCPLKFGPKSKELARLKKAYYILGHKRQQKTYGRQMFKKIRQLERYLTQEPKACAPHEVNQCQQSYKPYTQLETLAAVLHKRLAAIPAQDVFLQDYYRKRENLTQLGYLRDRELLARGKCASKIYVQELLVTELMFSECFSQLDDDQLNALLACVDFEARKNDYFTRITVLDMTAIVAIIKYLDRLCGEGTCRFDHRVAPLVHAWSQGASFGEVQKLCNLDEGDIISVLRRTIDLLRQMREATTDNYLRARFKECMRKLDRDEAAIEL
ncbi:MAG: helicase, partial [Peptococcaceae bacterium]|nr:helicase [Peptococcaceae bacterium]